MRTRFTFVPILACIALPLNAQLLHHDLHAELNIAAKSIDVSDSIRITPAYLKANKDSVVFYLNADLSVKSLNKSYELTLLKENSAEAGSEVKTKKYLVHYPKAQAVGFVLPLKYSGLIKGEIKANPADVARGFSETPGIICQDGVYLSGATVWVPSLNDTTFTFNLTTVMDTGWTVISQGNRTKNEAMKGKRIMRYESPNPADEVYLVAGRWTEYNKMAGNVIVQAVLRTPDAELANKYLDATVTYLGMYDKLIGPYPYSRFTLVENFWETGYGMPSFTLLGEKIIRFPFIINSSYPHELLHNYWGNSVYVNNELGNWCEGLTAYMADHLLKEQMGQGAEYRRVTLQKFTDFVNESNDMPVSKFRSRRNSAEEAIGYGKVSMIYDMLRYKFGDDVFKKSIADFYQNNKFKMASFNDIRKSFEKVTGQNLKPYFDQWVLRTGAPSLKLSETKVDGKDGNYEISFRISQVQKEDPFALDIPVVIYLEGVDTICLKNVSLVSRSEVFHFSFNKRPLRLDVDPAFNVFRRLDKAEVPYTLSQIYGDKDAAIILPKKSPFLKDYEDLAQAWKQTQEVQGLKLEILYDTDLKEAPQKAYWVLGFDNKFAAKEALGEYTSFLAADAVEKAEGLKKNGSLVYVFPGKDKQVTNAFVAGNSSKAIAALKRKITHYSKYSYLGFEGDEAENKLKGEFPALASPLSVFIPYQGKTMVPTAKFKPRKALVY